MSKIAVIIPYYQKQNGILRRAVRSITEQQSLPHDAQIDIIVVDDGSPIPAKDEIEGVFFAPFFRMNIVEQRNAGVAAARNAGLHHSGDAAYIAFLDSDDIWSPEHLAGALTALESGFDYYFCDSRRVGSYESYFKLIAFNPVSTPIAPDKQELREIDRNTLFDLCLRINASLTSTIVYRKSIAPDQTFNTWLHPAGEDNLFFLQLISHAKRTCFSTKISVTYAGGVNIWHSRYSWDAPTHAVSQLCRVLSAQEMKKTIPMSENNRKYLDGEIMHLRRFYSYLTIRRFLKMRKLWPKGEMRLMRCDTTSWLWYPLGVFYIAVCFPLGIYKPPLE
jgi:succinoglycan biosynthesis protein ExoW